VKLGILTVALVAISTGAAAKDSPVIDQREYLDGNGQPTLERKVLLENTKGEDVVVTQILHPLDDGSLQYIPTQQPLETQAFDAELCGPTATPPTAQAVDTWGPGTIHAFACNYVGVTDEATLGPEVDSENQVAPGIVLLRAQAPGNYVVRAGTDDYPIGYGNYHLTAPGTLSLSLLVDNRCAVRRSDPVPGGLNGRLSATVRCHMPTPGLARTEMSACVGSFCNTDRNSISVF